jgi:hypothetical protein
MHSSVAEALSNLQPRVAQAPLTITLCDGSPMHLPVSQLTSMSAPKSGPKPGSTRHSFGQRAWKNAAKKKVRVMIKDLPPASNKSFQKVDKVRLATLIRNTFEVNVDVNGSTCEILQATSKNAKRSGYIDVSRHAAETIAAKLATGFKLELICGPKKSPKV